MHHYYVYYRVDPARVAEAAAVVDRFQDDVHRRTGVRGRRLHRRDEPMLWMEVYEHVSTSSDLSALLADVPGEMRDLLAPGGMRTVETFLD